MSSGLKRSVYLSQMVGKVKSSKDRCSMSSLSSRESVGCDFFRLKFPKNVQCCKEHTLQYTSEIQCQNKVSSIKGTLNDMLGEGDRGESDLNSMHNAQWEVIQQTAHDHNFHINPLLFLLESREKDQVLPT
jgi:hypothetical protein